MDQDPQKILTFSKKHVNIIIERQCANNCKEDTMSYEKPTTVTIQPSELNKIVIAGANSTCGSIGCETTWAGNAPDCSDTYHDGCLEENNWSSGECQYGTWKDR